MSSPPPPGRQNGSSYGAFKARRAAASVARGRIAAQLRPKTKALKVSAPARPLPAPAMCAHFEFQTAKLLHLMKYRKAIENEIDRVEAAIAAVGRRLDPWDAKAAKLYVALARLYNAKAIPNARVGINLTQVNNLRKQLNISQHNVGNWYGSTAAWRKRMHTMTQLLEEVMRVFRARAPLDAEHEALSKKLGKLSDSIGLIDRRVAAFETAVQGCLRTVSSTLPKLHGGLENNLR